MSSGSRVTVVNSSAWGFFFFLAYIGAAVYFISVSDGSFWGVILGLLQSVVWPAYLIYGMLGALGV